MPSRLTPSQIRDARGMFDWSMFDLAREAGVSVSTVKRTEMHGPQPLSDGIQLAVRAAFEAAGVQFLDDDGAGPEMRLQGEVARIHPTTAAMSPRSDRLRAMETPVPAYPTAPRGRSPCTGAPRSSARISGA